MKKLILLTLIAITFSAYGFGQAKPETSAAQTATKMTPEELISKHLRSVGTPEALSAAKSTVVVGSGRLTSRAGFVAKLDGPAQFASEGNKILFAMIFNSVEYPYEKAAYNGDDITIGLPPRGRRSLLGDFLKSHSAILKQGLFGGVLSSAWVLRNGNTKGEFDYDGLAKVGERQLHKLKFAPARGGSLRVSLYFEPETFRHLMTEYQYIVSPQIGATRTSNANQREQRYTMIETFSDFTVAGQLTMPQTYNIDLSIYSETTQSLQWTMKFSEFYFNESIGAEAFKVS